VNTLRSLSKKHRFVVVAVAMGTALLLGLSACGGGGSSSETGPSPQQIARYKKLGALHVHKEVRLRRLEKELRQVKHGGPAVSAQVPRVESNPVPTPAPAVPTTETCGGELTVNSDTSCPFAEAVEDAYYEEVGSGGGTVEAYSPVTEKLYSMSCSGSPHECVGGNNAVVYFP
jgi:hypothetical protein